MKKLYFPLAIIIVIFAVIAFIFYFLKQPVTAPTNNTVNLPITTLPIASTTPALRDDITVTTPAVNSTITSPLTITGQARGSWYFEAVFPVKLYDADNKLIVSGQAQAQGEWTTDDFVPFTATLTFSQPTTDNGYLILANDNPSGLPANSKEIKIPVNFAPVEKTTVKIFFGNSQLNPNSIDCAKTFAVNRLVNKTATIGQVALTQLLLGPSDEEKANGYLTSINPGVAVKSLTIANGIAKVDFSAELDKAVGGSCRVTAIRAQISDTLKQFPTVKKVIISVDGRIEDVLQP